MPVVRLSQHDLLRLVGAARSRVRGGAIRRRVHGRGARAFAAALFLGQVARSSTGGFFVHSHHARRGRCRPIRADPHPGMYAEVTLPRGNAARAPSSFPFTALDRDAGEVSLVRGEPAGNSSRQSPDGSGNPTHVQVMSGVGGRRHGGCRAAAASLSRTAECATKRWKRDRPRRGGRLMSRLRHPHAVPDRRALPA